MKLLYALPFCLTVTYCDDGPGGGPGLSLLDPLADAEGDDGAEDDAGAEDAPAENDDIPLRTKQLRKFLSSTVVNAIKADSDCARMREYIQAYTRKRGCEEGTMSAGCTPRIPAEGETFDRIESRFDIKRLFSVPDFDYWNEECGDNAMIHKQYAEFIKDENSDAIYYEDCKRFYNAWSPRARYGNNGRYKPVMKSINSLLRRRPELKGAYKACNLRTIWCIHFQRDITNKLPLDRNEILWISRCSHEPGMEKEMRQNSKVRGQNAQ